MLVHGTGARWQTWGPVIAPLAEHLEVLALDLPGFGDSPPLERAPTLRALAEAVREAAGDEPFHVAGYSLGGAVALELGRMGAARTVAALAPIGFWTPRERAYCIASMQVSQGLAARIAPHAEKLAGSPLGRALMAQLVARPANIPSEDAVLAIEGMAAAGEAVEAVLDHAFVERDPGTPLPCPLTIAWGTHDRLLLPRQAERARKTFPTATHVSLRGCGHLPTWDDPEAVTQVLLEATRRSQPQPARAAA